MSGKHILAVLAFATLAGSVHAQPTDPRKAEILQRWHDMPETTNPMEEIICRIAYLKPATGIDELMGQQASVSEVKQWEDGIISATTKILSDRAPIDVFAEQSINLGKLIQHAREDEPIYRYVRGGFPQYAYRSCLKGIPLK